VADVLDAEGSGVCPGVRPAEPDPSTGAVGFDVVLAGDAFYSKAMSDRMTGFLRRVAGHGAHVLAGDPERKFLRRELFQLAAVDEVPVPRVLEGVRVRRTSVWELPGRSGQPEREGR
jgi:predicted nicotinamide N-methyase